MILRSGRRGREFDSPCTPFNSGPCSPVRVAMSSWLDHGSFLSFRHREPGWRSWLAREIHNLEVAGSIPAPGTFYSTQALVAQLAALRSYEPMAQGSSPCRSTFCFIIIGWMAEWSKALVLGTSLFGGEGSNPSSVIDNFCIVYTGD